MRHLPLDTYRPPHPHHHRGILTLVCWLSIFSGFALSATPEGSAPPIQRALLKPALGFEVNVGQVEAPIQYLARGLDYGIFLTPTEAVLVLNHSTSSSQLKSENTLSPPTSVPVRQATLHFQFIGDTVQPSAPLGLQELPGKSHYFLGNDPAEWHTNVPQYAQVIYKEVYPGIDVVYYGREGLLEYDLVVAPDANPDNILLEINGSQRLALLPDGTLNIETPLGTVQHHKPIFYQKENGRKHFIDGTYQLPNPSQVSFEIDQYDPTRPLYIDPVLSYGSYVPSKGVNGLALDENNAIYITGAALPLYSADLNALGQPPQGYLDLFVSKFDPTGTQLIYSAYLGGEWDDQGRDLAVDEEGNVYVVGFSSSPNFPVVNPLEFDTPFNPDKPSQTNGGSTNAGSYDVVIAKLNATGSVLKYASYLGGCGEDGFFGNLAIAIGEDHLEARDEDDPPLRTVYITGSTNSPDFPLLDSFQPAYGRTLDTFVTKIRAEEQSFQVRETPGLIYSTFLGGTNSDIAGDIAIDEDGHAYIVGTTFSTDFPTINAFQKEIGKFPSDIDPPFPSDIFLTKLEPDGLGLVYSTYLGGDGADEGYGLALNQFGQVFITGSTRSNDFPKTPKRTPRRKRRDADVIVSQFSSLPGILHNSVIIGGSADDTGLSIALERDRQVWVTGRTASGGFPTTLQSPQRLLGKLITGDDPDIPLADQITNTTDAFVFHLTLDRETPIFSTYLGGNGLDEGRAIVTRLLEVPPTPGKLTSTVVVGRTSSTDFPRTAARHPLPSGGFLVDFLESEVPEDRFPCPIFCFPIPLPNPPFLTPSFPPITADLTITMTDTPDPVILGQPLDYTITVTNIGSHTASNVRVTDVLPPWFQLTTVSPNPESCRPHYQNQALVCFLGSLGPEAQTTLTISGIPLASSILETISEEDESGEIQTIMRPIKEPNRASVFNDLPDSDYTNNSTAVFTGVIDPNAETLNSPLADLSVMKNDLFLRFDFEKREQEIVTPEDPDPITNATVGRPYIYEIKVTNAEEVAVTVTQTDENGDPIQQVRVVPTSAAANVILTDLLPPDLTAGFLTINPPQGSCQIIPDFRCFLGNLDPGAEVTVTIWVMPSVPTDTVNGVLVTTSTTEPPGRSRNTDTEDTAIQIPQAIEEADLRVTFTDEEELVLTEDEEDQDEEEEEEEEEEKPDPVDPDQQTGRGEVTWKLEVLNAGPDKAVNVLATSRLRVMDIPGIPPTPTRYLDSIPPSPRKVRTQGARHFQPMKGEIITEDNLEMKCPDGKTLEGEECEVDGPLECALCEEFSPLCVLCQGKNCGDLFQAFRTEEELSPEGEPTGDILVKWEPVDPEDIIPETILSELEDPDDQDKEFDVQEEIVLSCNIGTLEAEEKFLLDFSVDLTQGIHNSSAEVTSLTFDPKPGSNKAIAKTTVAVPAGHPTRGGVGGNSGSGTSCFIATAAYGTAFTQEVEILRTFRDTYLLHSSIGHALVDAYYRTSPPFADVIRHHSTLKAMVRGALWPIVWWADLTLSSPTVGFTVFGGGFLSTICWLSWIIRTRLFLAQRRRSTPNS